MTSTNTDFGAAAAAPALCVTDRTSEEQPLLPENGCFCVQRPSQRLVIPPHDDAVIDRSTARPRARG